jgi:hypothetical protein
MRKGTAYAVPFLPLKMVLTGPWGHSGGSVRKIRGVHKMSTNSMLSDVDNVRFPGKSPLSPTVAETGAAAADKDRISFQQPVFLRKISSTPYANAEK